MKAAIILALAALAFTPHSEAEAGNWSYTAGPNGSRTSMQTGRVFHTATLLDPVFCGEGRAPKDYPCGSVLVTGGVSGDWNNGEVVASAELYDPKQGSWRSCKPGAEGSRCPSPLRQGRARHSASLINGENCGSKCGMVLVVGGSGKQRSGAGYRSIDLTLSAELYDPLSGRWQELAIPSSVGFGVTNLGHSATALTSGEVLFVGREGIGLPTSQTFGLLFNPAKSGPSAWSNTNSPNIAGRSSGGVAVLLAGPNCFNSCGKVLIAGGGGSLGEATASLAELYDPEGRVFEPTASMAFPAVNGDAAQLPGGKVLLAGQSRHPFTGRESQIYDPATGTWAPSGLMGVRRGGNSFLAEMPDKRILAAGGNNEEPNASLAEIYDINKQATSSPGEWTPSGSLNQARQYAQVTPLSCAARPALVLISGGIKQVNPNSFHSVNSAEVYEEKAAQNPGCRIPDSQAARGSGDLSRPGKAEPSWKLGVPAVAIAALITVVITTWLLIRRFRFHPRKDG